MEEKKYHFEEQEGEGMVCEPAPAYRTVVAEPMYSTSHLMDWDEEEEMEDEFNTDSYPLGRSLEQVKAHCAEIDRYLDDPNYGTPVAVLNARLLKMAERWR